MSTLQILGLIYIVVILMCIFEAYLCTDFDPESKKLIKERREKSKNKNN